MRLVGGILLFAFVALILFATIREVMRSAGNTSAERRKKEALYREWIAKGDLSGFEGASTRQIKNKLFADYLRRGGPETYRWTAPDL